MTPSGQISIIPKPEIKAMLGRIPSQSPHITTILGDQPAEKVVIICPDTMIHQIPGSL